MKFERDLGNLAEAVFGKWCASAGIVCNESQIDRTGWDFIVEFPFNESLDTHSAAIECRIQVKGTDSRERKKQIKLSNLRRLSTALVPTFILLLEFDGMDNPQRGFLCHINHDLQTKIVAKIHEKKVADPVAELHKSTMVISFENSDGLTEMSGQALREKILTCVGNDFPRYVDEKTAHLKSTGYEDGYGLIKFSVSGEQDIHDLVDLSLGIEGAVQIQNFRFTKGRFGITDKTPSIEEEIACISMPAIRPISKGELHFLIGSGMLPIKVPVDIYSSPFNPHVPDELFKMRLAAEGMEFIIHPFTQCLTLTTSLGAGKNLLPSQMRDTLKVIECFRSGTTQTIELHSDGRSTITFPGITSDGHLDLDFDCNQCIAGATACIKLLADFEVDEFPIMLEELVQNSENYIQFSSILSSSSPSLMMEFSLLKNELDLSQPVVIIQMLKTLIGGVSLGILFTLKGDTSQMGASQYSLIANEFSIEGKFISEAGKPIPKTAIQSVADSVAEKYDPDHQVVLLPKFAN